MWKRGSQLQMHFWRTTNSLVPRDETPEKCGLETKLHADFDGSGATDLERRSEAATWATAAQHEIEHRHRLSEEGLIEITDRISRISMIEGVERIDVQLQRRSFRYGEAAPQSEVEL